MARDAAAARVGAGDAGAVPGRAPAAVGRLLQHRQLFLVMDHGYEAVPCDLHQLVGAKKTLQQDDRLGDARLAQLHRFVEAGDAEAVRRLERALPERRARNGRDTGAHDQIAPPRRAPVGQDDAGNGPFVVDPEELVDRVRAARCTP